MMNWPLLSRLLAKEPRPPLNLLEPDILVEFHIHILPSGNSKMFCSKLPPTTKPEELVHIVKTLIDQAIAFGAQHGVQVQVTPQVKPP